MLKRILKTGMWLLALAAVIAFEFFALQQNNETNCKEMQVKIKNKNNIPLLTSEKELKTNLLQNYLPVEGQKIKNLNLKQIEKNIGDLSYLNEHDAYFQVNGVLNVIATPRKAVVRIYNEAGQHFYLGADTVVMPLAPQHSIRLLMANGNIKPLDQNFFKNGHKDFAELPQIYKKIYNLASKIQEDEFLNALIDQIYVNQEQEFELIPKAGVGLIVFGNLDQADDKLKRLKNFYIEGKDKINWDIYKSINLKYTNQIVCTKK